MADDKRSFAGTPKQANRGRAQKPNGAATATGEEPWLAEGTPANVDVHNLGDQDVPEDDWGEPADEGTMHGQTHTRRPIKTEADRGQGKKTRQLNKDIVSRRT